jgi:hypothetical protein
MIRSDFVCGIGRDGYVGLSVVVGVFDKYRADTAQQLPIFLGVLQPDGVVIPEHESLTDLLLPLIILLHIHNNIGIHTLNRLLIDDQPPLLLPLIDPLSILIPPLKLLRLGLINLLELTPHKLEMLVLDELEVFEEDFGEAVGVEAEVVDEFGGGRGWDVSDQVFLAGETGVEFEVGVGDFLVRGPEVLDALFGLEAG